MRKLKKVATIVLIGMMLFGIVGCGNKMTDQEKIVGTWVMIPDENEINETLIFFSDGTGYCKTTYPSDEEFKLLINAYSIDQGNLKLTLSNGMITQTDLYQYSFKGNDTMTIIANLEDGSEEISVYNRTN